MPVSRRLAGRTAIAAGLALAGLVATGPAGAVTATQGGHGAAAPSAVRTSATATGGVTLGRSTIAWHRCSDASLRGIGAQCAMLRVPLDYSRPAGATIQLALSRVRHTVPASQFQGVMLVNPGGPGGSGLSLSVLGKYVPHHVGAAYDWIGFDPRGVGASRPAVSCDDHYFGYDRPNYNPRSARNLHAWMAKVKAYDAACAAKNGPILDNLTTEDSARDMNRIRIALGAHRINYYGFSYGTYLGQVYATLFPHTVRRMVLDSNVDPRRVWYPANLDQDKAFMRTERAWFAWIARYRAVFHLGSTEKVVEKHWFHIRGELAVSPDHGIGPDEWTDSFLQAGYYQSTWVDEATLFAGWVHHHTIKKLRAAYASANGLGDDNGYAVYLGVQCTDVQWPTSWAKWAADNTRINAVAPFETWANAWYNAPCLYWPGAVHTPVTINGRQAPPTLLIDETLDAATPYPGSLEVRTLFPRSRLIALPGGTSHANSLFGNACLDNQIAAYLKAGTLPARKAGNRADATCAPLPVPNPTAH